jgi:hypothetical protein
MIAGAVAAATAAVWRNRRREDEWREDEVRLAMVGLRDEVDRVGQKHPD